MSLTTEGGVCVCECVVCVCVVCGICVCDRYTYVCGGRCEYVWGVCVVWHVHVYVCDVCIYVCDVYGWAVCVYV